MPAYWIAHVTVTDPHRYVGYQLIARDVFGRFGGLFIARGGAAEVLEGPQLERHVVIEFPDMARALECYNSPAYKAAREARAGACIAHVVIVQGAS